MLSCAVNWSFHTQAQLWYSSVTSANVNYWLHMHTWSLISHLKSEFLVKFTSRAPTLLWDIYENDFIYSSVAHGLLPLSFPLSCFIITNSKCFSNWSIIANASQNIPLSFSKYHAENPKKCITSCKHEARKSFENQRSSMQQHFRHKTTHFAILTADNIWRFCFQMFYVPKE